MSDLISPSVDFTFGSDVCIGLVLCLKTKTREVVISDHRNFRVLKGLQLFDVLSVQKTGLVKI